MWLQQVYNVGANDSNYQVSEIAKIVREELDRDLVMTYLEDENPGPSYHVNFDRLAETGFEPEWTLREGIRDIATELQSTAAVNI
jgi:nucleoside-diphosphate-sugar epimerase